MNTNRTAVLVGMFAIAFGNLLVLPSTITAGEARRTPAHFDLVNATFDSVVAIAIAPANEDAFDSIALDQPLQGGLTSMTFDVPAGGCLRDLRITFHGGRTQLFPAVDLCRTSGLRLTSHGAAEVSPG